MASSARFDRRRVRLLKIAESDADYRYFDRNSHIDLLLSFLWQFAKLGWVPPRTSQAKASLAVHDLRVHDHDSSRFYSFELQGNRGERDPFLVVFFHIDATSVIRLIGFAARQRNDARKLKKIIEIVAQRSAAIDKLLERSDP